MEYVKQGGIGHKRDRLYIHWDITTMCQYRCSYCYAIKEYDDKWMRPGNWNKQQEVIDELSKASLPVFLGLLGGEPTLHHKYFELLKLLNDKVISNHKDSRLYITTNGSREIDFYQKHPKVNNTNYMLFSWHPEYENDKSIKEYLNKIKAVQELGYRCKINIMLHPKKNFWENTEKCIIKSVAIKDLEVHPHLIYSDPHNALKYSDEFYNFFQSSLFFIKPEFYIETNNQRFELNDSEFAHQKLNKFKDWNCWNNNYEINLNCKINQFCFEEKQSIKKNYFKNIKEVLPKRCPHEYCSCDGLLKIYKEKY